MALVKINKHVLPVLQLNYTFIQSMVFIKGINIGVITPLQLH